MTIAGNDIFISAPRQADRPVALLDVVGGRNWVVRDIVVADFEWSQGNKVSYGMYLKGNSSNGVFERNLILCNWKHSGGVRIALSLGGDGTSKAFCERQECATEHTGGIIRNNVISGDVRDRDGARHTEANNLIVPQPYMLEDVFIDHANAVFRLKNERKVMGKDRRVPEVTDDFCSRRRTLPAYDLGAIEYGPGRCTVANMFRRAQAYGD